MIIEKSEFARLEFHDDVYIEDIRERNDCRSHNVHHIYMLDYQSGLQRKDYDNSLKNSYHVIAFQKYYIYED